MAYVEYEGAATQYIGTSFSRTLTKKDGSAWDANEVATYVMTLDGVEVDSGSLTKSTDNLGLIFEVGQTVTAAFVGTYKLRVYLEDTSNAEFSGVIADYVINYEAL